MSYYSSQILLNTYWLLLLFLQYFLEREMTSFNGNTIALQDLFLLVTDSIINRIDCLSTCYSRGKLFYQPFSKIYLFIISSLFL